MSALAHTSPDHLVEDLEFLAAHGVGASEAARRTGMHGAKNLDKWLRRHGHGALANRLHRQEPLALVPSRKER